MPTSNISILQANYSNTTHCQTILRLLDEYMKHPMGGGNGMPKSVAESLIEGLAESQNTFILLAQLCNEYVGLTTCFVNFSTFKAKPYINVHDIIVTQSYQDKGIGRILLSEVIALAKRRGYCKVTLEVRHDNANAMHLYQSLGFRDGNPPMYFWTKEL